MMTFLLIVSFLLLFMASKSSGLTSMFGRVLGLWLLVIAAIAAGGVGTAVMNGGRPYGLDMPMMRGEGMRCCHGMQPKAPPAPAVPDAPPAQPAPVAPPA
jgi:hypothetical protein